MPSAPHAEPTALDRGRAALARGAWEEAVEALRAAVRGDSADGHAREALGAAYMWLDEMDAAIAAREDAYALFREAGDDASAARVAMDLAYDMLEVRGETAVGLGWIQRARRLLEGCARTRELALLRIWDAYLSFDDDPVAAAEHAREAVEVSEEAGAQDTHVLALALEGTALVCVGRLDEGMRLLDEAIAAAIGRELSDPQWFYMACCCMIDACDQVRDFERSLEWCHRLRAFSTRWRVRAFMTTCRVKFTGALLWRGDWAACEEELERAIEELGRDGRPALGVARVRLAELRRRQGRREEAEALLDEAAQHPAAELVWATIALEDGDAAGAADRLEAVIRRTPDAARSARVGPLELGTRVHLALGDVERAEACAEELGRIAKELGTKAFRAAALAAAGRVAAARGEPERARELLDDAAHLAEAGGSPWECARIRLELADVLSALERRAAAEREAERASAAFERLGARGDAEAARRVLTRLEGRDAKKRARGGAGPLTRRQREVLELIAAGLSDREVAERLFLSEHTVHRHVANILGRLGVASRAAAVAQAMRAEII